MTQAVNGTGKRFTAIVVDDDVILRRRLSGILSGAGDFEVLGKLGRLQRALVSLRAGRSLRWSILACRMDMALK